MKIVWLKMIVKIEYVYYEGIVAIFEKCNNNISIGFAWVEIFSFLSIINLFERSLFLFEVMNHSEIRTSLFSTVQVWVLRAKDPGSGSRKPKCFGS